MFKKILGLCVFAFVLLGVTNIVTAQTEQVVKQINIQSIVLDKTTFNTGDEVKGKFVVSNPNTTDFNDVYYKVSLVGAYDKNNFPNEIYNSSDLLGPDLIPANKNNEVDFYYNLPKNIAGDLGIQVRALTKTGKSLAWIDTKIKVNGQSKYIDFSSAKISVAGVAYNLGSGPMINEGQKAVLMGVVSNPAKTSYTVTPVIKVYDRVVIDTPIYSKNLSPISLSASARKDLSVELPLFDYNPKVYAGTIEFVDQQGVSMSASYDFRYIVAGDIVTIQSASVTGEGKQVQVETTFTGAPFDIATGETRRQGNGTMSVYVLNERGDLLGTNTTEVSLDDTQSVSTEVDLKGSATEVQVKVEIKKGDKVLANYTAKPVSYLLNEIKTFSTTYIIAIALILVLLFVVGVTLIKRKISKTLIICLLIVAGLSIAGFGSVSLAGTSLIRPPGAVCPGRINGVCPSSTTVTPVSNSVISCTNSNPSWVATGGTSFMPGFNGYFTSHDMSVNLSHSSSGNTLQPGEQFSLQFNVQASACANTSDYVGVAVTYPASGQPNQAEVMNWLSNAFNKKDLSGKPSNMFLSVKNNGLIYSGVGHAVGKINTDVNGGTYTAPTTPGTYRIYFTVVDLWAANNITLNSSYNFFDGSHNGASVIGYKDIVVCASPVVVPTDLCPLIDGIQTTTPCSGGSNDGGNGGGTQTTNCTAGQTLVNGVCVSSGTNSGVGKCHPETSSMNPAKSAKVGDLVTWVVDGSPAPTTYSWIGDEVPASSPANRPLQIRYATGGKKTVSIVTGTGATASAPTQCTIQGTTDNKIQIVNLPGFQEF